MSGFFNRLKNLEIQNINMKTQTTDDVIEHEDEQDKKKFIAQEEKNLSNGEKSIETPYDCLQAVLDE